MHRRLSRLGKSHSPRFAACITTISAKQRTLDWTVSTVKNGTSSSPEVASLEFTVTRHCGLGTAHRTGNSYRSTFHWCLRLGCQGNRCLAVILVASAASTWVRLSIPSCLQDGLFKERFCLGLETITTTIQSHIKSRTSELLCFSSEHQFSMYNVEINVQLICYFMFKAIFTSAFLCA